MGKWKFGVLKEQFSYTIITADKGDRLFFCGTRQSFLSMFEYLNVLFLEFSKIFTLLCVENNGTNVLVYYMD